MSVLGDAREAWFTNRAQGEPATAADRQLSEDVDRGVSGCWMSRADPARFPADGGPELREDRHP